MKYKLMKKTFLFVTVLLTTNYAAHCQKQADTLWKTAVDQKIMAIEVAANGNLIATGEDNTYGIDPMAGNVLWTNPLKKGKLDYYPGTDFIMVDDHVVNPDNGKNVNLGTYLSTAEGDPITVLKQYFLYDNDLVISYGTVNTKANSILESDEQKQVISLTQLSTGNNFWTRDDYFQKPRNVLGEGKFAKSKLGSMMGKSMGKSELAQKDAKTGGYRVLTDPVATSFNSIILPMKHALEAVDITTGNILWQVDYPTYKATNLNHPSAQDGTTVIAISADGKVVYVTRMGVLMAIDVQTGKGVWNDPIMTYNIIGYIRVLDNGVLVLPMDETISITQREKAALYNAADGNKIWETQIAGKVLQYAVTGLGTAMAMENYQKNELINVIDTKTGALLLDSKYKISGVIQNMQSIPAGVLYMTDKEANVLDIKQGEAINDRSIHKKEDGEYLTLDQPDAFYIMVKGENELKKIDKNTGIIAPFAKETIAFKNKERPEYLEAYNGKIIASSSQNIISYNLDGSVLFQKYYPAPSISRMWKVANAFGVVASSKAQRNISQRFKKSKEQKDDLYMLSNNDDGDLSILKVKKSDGTVDETVPLVRKDRDPVYTIDDISNSLYYVPNFSGEKFDLFAGSKNGKGGIIAYKTQ